MSDGQNRLKGLPGKKWLYSYKTSAVSVDGRPLNILHDFYIPALRRSVRYDRVAGYFRSTSLAAASQGFSAFTASGGKMRLLVGADLSEEDVAAIIQGDARRMTKCLSDDIGDPGAWPEDVTRGVELLAWMIANGYLEVRVAFRLHKETARPIAFAGADDGYVHEKWALFKDTEGNRIYISGSLNESKTALVQNAENIDVHADWWGGIECQRADEAEAGFNIIWNDQNPHLRVMTLPQAVQKKLIKIGRKVSIPTEIDNTSAYPVQIPPPSAMERLKFALVKDGPRLSGGRFVGIETVPFEPWPHQEIVARRLIATWPYSYLLCDEVGLGKTIEAGLAIRSLYLAGLIRRVLITPPASLTRQWQREMKTKFFLPFARGISGTAVRHETLFPIEEIQPATNLYEPDLCIVSTGLLRRKERQRDLKRAQNFDICLVDEAHYARRKNPRNGKRSHPQFGGLYKIINDTLNRKTNSLWLATATPMQLDWIEAFDLVSLIQRVGSFQFDPTLTWAYYEALGTLVRGSNIDGTQWDFLRRAIVDINQRDPFLRMYLDQTVVVGMIQTVARQWLERGIAPTGVDRQRIQRLIFSAAPLSRVMLRHTRPLLEIYREKGELSANLAKREVLPVPRIVLSGIEKTAYEELEAYCRDLTTRIAVNSSEKKYKNNLGFLLSFLRLRLASSMYAIRETLRRRKERVEATLQHLIQTEQHDLTAAELKDFLTEEDDENEEIINEFLKNRTPSDLEWERDRLGQMLDTLGDLAAMPLKMKELLSVLNQRRIPGRRIEQTVIFTRFFDTLSDIVMRLLQIDSSMLIGTYSGKGGQYLDPRTKRLRRVDREEIKQRFLRGEIDVLVCTDAAAEGLNLQTANLLVNYDLPWNPMKVEQRIGRIDRIGQKHGRIYVLNLCYVDSAEQIVYDRLLTRLALAHSIVGTQQISMLSVRPEEFEALAAGTLNPEELEGRAKERYDLQRKRSERMEIPAKDLYDIYVRLKDKEGAAKVPVDLESIWKAMSSSKYLRDLGCTVSAEEEQKVMILRGLSSIPDGTFLTASRRVYEEGLLETKVRPHFATYGDTAFEAVLEEIDKHKLPGCIARLKEPVPDLDVEVVGYTAACQSQSGDVEIKLVTSIDDLENVRLHESAQISDYDQAKPKEELNRLARQEFDPTRSVTRLEKENRRAAGAQIILDFLAARNLITPVGATDDDNFWVIIKELDNLLTEREQLIIPNLPVDPLNKIQKDVLFDIPIPNVGEKTNITAPILLVEAAVDAACRLADAMKVKKATLIRSRLEREIGRYLKAI